MNFTTDYVPTLTTLHYILHENIDAFSIIALLIIIGGTIGNIISFCLFALRPRLRSQPVSVYICGLAVADTGVLWVVNARDWSLQMFKHYLPIFGSMCNVYWFTSSVLIASSAWINVVMTFDRIIAVFFPLHYKVSYKNLGIFKIQINIAYFFHLQIFYSRKRSLIAVMMALALLTAAFFPDLFAYQSYAECFLNNNKFTIIYVNYMLPVLTLTLWTAIPDIVFFVGNIAILIRVRRHRSEVTSGGSRTSDDTSQGRVTRTAVTLSLMHLILTLPSIINSNVSQRQLKNSLNLLDMGLTSVALANHGINVFIYLATSQVFRQELKKVVLNLLPKQQLEGNTNSTATASTVM